MEIRIARDVLAEAVGWAAQGLPGRSPAVPVLGGLRLAAGGGRLAVSGFDYEVSAVYETAVEQERPGSVLVPGRLLAEISRTLPPGEVRLRTEGPDVLVSCGPAEFALPALPLAEYPALPQSPPVRGRVDGAVFAAAVAQVASVAGRDEALPVLTGIRLEFEPGLLRLVATDRYRLAVRELAWEGGGAEPEGGAEGASDGRAAGASALVPARGLLAVARSLGREGGAVEIGLSDEAGLAGFAAGGRRATARLLSGAFIDYRRIFPAEYAGTAVVERTALLGAVRRVGLVAAHGAPLRLVLAAGRITVEAGSGGEARGREALPAEHGGEGGEEICLRANPGYLADGLGGITSERVAVRYTTPTRPAVLTGVDEPGYRYLFMPLRPV